MDDVQSGLLLVDKPAGMSSAAVVGAVKRRFSYEKVGHAGTLDPMATGLLVCVVGAATRLASYAEGGRKTYSGTIRLGLVTDTDDITGATLESSGEIPHAVTVIEASRELVGNIMQTPPRVSAVKVAGKRAYARARAGEDLRLEPRPTTVYRFDIEALSTHEYRFEIDCSKGTYIRSIARDLGAKLGCGGCLASLRREGSEPFDVSDAKPLDDLTGSDLRPWGDLFPGVLRVEVPTSVAARLRGGDTRELGAVAERLRTLTDSTSLPVRAIYSDASSGEELGLLLRQDGRWRFGVNV